MKKRDPHRARSMAFQLVSELKAKHASTLERLSDPTEVETALPLGEVRAEYQKKVAPELHHVFDDAVRTELLEPIAARAEDEAEALEREAVREDTGYRTAEERPKPRPKPKPAPAPPSRPEKLEPGLAQYRSAGTILLWVGVASAVGMFVIAAGAARNDSLAHRAQTSFVTQSCTVTDSRDVKTEGGGTEHVVAFESEKHGKRYRHDRYSPDVDHGPGASWMPVGKVVDCVCDPNDPAVCFLHAGRKDRESTPWVFVVVIPLLFIGIGFAMRSADKLPEGD